MSEDTLASVLRSVMRLRSPGEATELACAIALCDECGRAQATQKRNAVGLAALKMYTLDYPCVYADLNAAMRANDASAIAPYGQYVRTMLEAMLVSPRFEGATVYRGIRLDMRAACTKGATLVWPEFASCTSSIETQETFLGPTGDRTLFVLTVTQGRARSIADVSMIGGESEVLLPPNTRITVESAYRAGSGLLLVNATEMPTECMLGALEIVDRARRAHRARKVAECRAKVRAREEAQIERQAAEAEHRAMVRAREDAQRLAASAHAAEKRAAERRAKVEIERRAMDEAADAERLAMVREWEEAQIERQAAEAEHRAMVRAREEAQRLAASAHAAEKRAAERRAKVEIERRAMDEAAEAEHRAMVRAREAQRMEAAEAEHRAMVRAREEAQRMEAQRTEAAEAARRAQVRAREEAQRMEAAEAERRAQFRARAEAQRMEAAEAERRAQVRAREEALEAAVVQC